MRVDEIEIPDDWCKLLTELQNKCRTAILAGGAMRDLFYGRPVKDLDFFITLDAGQSAPYLDISTRSEFDYDGMKYVLCVYTIMRFGLEVNIIITEHTTINELLDSFDLGFCQIAFDGKKIIKTAAFDWDFKYGVITMRQINRYTNTIKRYCRINKKYDLNLIIPELEARR